MSLRLLVRRTTTPILTTPLDGETLVEPGRYDWTLLDVAGQLLASGIDEPREAILDHLERNGIAPGRLVGLVPAHELVVCSANIPGRQSRFIHQALPYAVEEQIGEDIDNMHLALGGRQKDGQYEVIAVDHSRMRGYYADYRDWPWLLVGMHADAQLLPVSEDVPWLVIVEGEWSLVHHVNGFFSRVKTGNLPILLEALVPDELADDARPEALRMLVTPEERENLGLLLASIQQIPTLSVTTEDLDATALTVLATGLQRGGARLIDLCQGEYPSTKEGGGTWHRWRGVAAIALVWLGLQVGLDLGRGWYDRQQALAIEQQGLSLYQEIFPTDRRVTVQNMRRQMESRLRAAGDAGPAADFLSLMRYAGYQYSVMPERSRLSFESINFSLSRGEMVIELRADSFERMNTLKNGLASMGLNARIGSVVNDADGARGRMTLGGS